MPNRVKIEIVDFLLYVLCKVEYFGIMMGGMAGVNVGMVVSGGSLDGLARMVPK